MAISDMLRHGKSKLNGHILEDAETLFSALDEDLSGTVDRVELRKGLKKIKIGCSNIQLEAWIDALDVNGKFTHTQRERERERERERI